MFGTRPQTKISWTYRWEKSKDRDQKSNLLFLERPDQSQRFWIKNVKNWQKNIAKVLVFAILDTIELKKIGDCEN